MKKIILFLLIIFAAAIVWFYNLYSSSLKYTLDSSSNDRVQVNIPDGSTSKQIGSILEDSELIKSTWVFNFYVKQNELSEKMKAGGYVFQKNQTLPEIVDILVKGGGGETSLTLLEGWTAKQMADYLEKEGVTKAEDFLNCLKKCNFDFNFLPKGELEGYLYPDTYFVDLNTYSNQEFITRLLNNFKNKLSQEDWTAINSSERSFEDIMIIASIVEREERAVSQKPIVAGILWNRIDSGMPLGADATVLYALDRTSGELNYDDLQIDSPYNTRKNAGLPPTPISNPSIESIKAALYPEKTDYLYYLHDSEGGIHYAENLEGHNENIEKYLR